MTVYPYKSTTILDGEDTSQSVHMQAAEKVMMVYADANFDGSLLSIQVDVGGGVWKGLIDDDGVGVVLTVPADEPVVIDANAGKVAQLRSFRVVSDVAQSGADCEIRFFMK